MDIILLFLAKPLDKHGTTLVHITYPPLVNVQSTATLNSVGTALFYLKVEVLMLLWYAHVFLDMTMTYQKYFSCNQACFHFNTCATLASRALNPLESIELVGFC